MSIPTILIVGRPNVGKSTLFNRLTKSHKSIVCDFPGVTRDLIFSHASWIRSEELCHNYLLVDSGGIFFEKVNENDGVFQKIIEQKVKEAIEVSDIVIFVTDAKDGVVVYDKIISKYLLPYKQKVFVAVNKSDNELAACDNSNFYQLGFDKLFFVSATQSIGVNDLLESIFTVLPESKQGLNQLKDDYFAKISIVGKPNVGKSSIINALSGEDKAIVSEIPGTTRDSTDHIIKYQSKQYAYIDTAGLRKKSKIANDIDFYSYVRTLRSICDSNISLLVVTANEDISEQDKHIANLIEEEGRSLIIIVNKWDLVEKDSHTFDAFTKYIYRSMPFLYYAPVLFVSAVTKQRLPGIYELIDMVLTKANRKLTKKELDTFLMNLKKQSTSPLIASGRSVIHYIKQDTTVGKVVFKFFVNKVSYFNEPLTRYLTKQLRQVFDFTGSPIKIEYTEVIKEKRPFNKPKERKY